MTTLRIESCPLDQLRPDPGNPRTHSEEQIRKVADSIREFGFLCPVVVDGGQAIIAGHARVEAARLLGLAAVPVIRAGHLSEAQRKAFLLADNKLAELAGWDEGLLREALADLRLEGYELILTGFDEADIDRLLESAGQAAEVGFPDLPAGDKAPYQEMTYTLHDDQARLVKAALDLAVGMGPFAGPNQNRNGNALARVCEAYLEGHGQG
jgi:ParB-like chromosome segregation protein Spo0J